MKKTARNLRVVAQLMECESLDEFSKEFIQETCHLAASQLETNGENREKITDKETTT